MRIAIFLAFFVITPAIAADETMVNRQITDTSTTPSMTPIGTGVTVDQAMRVVVDAMQNAFPAAYKQFLNVSLTYSEDGSTLPQKAQFYVPARFFEHPLDEKRLLARAKRMAYDIGGVNDCTDVELGESEQLGWLKWPDKVVRKVTVNFYFYC